MVPRLNELENTDRPKRNGSIFRRLEQKGKDLAGRHWAKLAELLRYYSFGIINTGFGYGLYSVFVFIGLNLFVAQIVGYVFSTTFNYFMYKFFVFKGSRSSMTAYVGAYALNYLLSLSFLAVAHHFIASPYVAGFVALLALSVLNYMILKRFVYRATHPS